MDQALVSHSGLRLAGVVSGTADFANLPVRKPGELRDAKKLGTREGIGVFKLAVFLVKTFEGDGVEDRLIRGNLGPDTGAQAAVTDGFDWSLVRGHGRSPFFDCLTPWQGNSKKETNTEQLRVNAVSQNVTKTLEFKQLRAPNSAVMKRKNTYG